MKYTTKQYRIDSDNKTIEVYKPTNIVELYSTLVSLWTKHTPFCATVFPGPITEMFPVDKATSIPVGVIKW